MMFNVRLRQSFIYEDMIEANNKVEAVTMARNNSKSDGLNWVPEGRLQTVSVEEVDEDPDPFDMTSEEADDLESCLTDMVMDYIFDDSDDDDPFGTAPQPVNA